VHLHLRPLVVLAAILFGVLVCGWGVATYVRPAWWSRRGAGWWVGWTREPVRRTHGAALAVVGVGIALAGIAVALSSPAEAMPPHARIVELIGLGVVVLGGAALVATHPAPLDGVEPQRSGLPSVPILPPISIPTTIPALDAEAPVLVAAVAQGS
jgi:hypothetical protein